MFSMMIHNIPQDNVEWVRFLSFLFGVTAFGLLVYRLIGRSDKMSLLSFVVTSLLTIAVLGFGLGAARAAQLDNRFNEVAILGLFVNVGATITAIVWHRWLDATGKRH